jgi:uncharacterized protein (DUF1501 family)
MLRRTFLQIGTAAAALQLPYIPSIVEAAETSSNNKAIIFVYLPGGASAYELTMPNSDSPYEAYRSVFGSIKTKSGYELCSLLPNLAKQSDRLNIVRSFGHGDSNHETATINVNTAYASKNPEDMKYPSYGAISSYIFGQNNKDTGLPLYIKNGSVLGDGGGYLGSSYAGYSANGSGVNNLILKVEEERLANRKTLLSQLDNIDKNISKGFKEIDSNRTQAYSTILGKAKLAFDTKKESAETIAKYSGPLGEKLLLARRLVEFGVKFVTVTYGGWDWHTNLYQEGQRQIPDLDRSLAVLINDIWERDLHKDVMVVLTSEFSRTGLNQAQSRDHNGLINNLLFSGGTYEHGRTIGEHDSKVQAPKGKPYTTQDLSYTLFNHLGIKDRIAIDNSGRPQSLIPSGNLIL